MQLILHESAQRTANGNGTDYVEPDLKVSAIVIKISAISVNLLGSVSFKLQHSEDGENWIDIPGLATGNLTSTGNTTIAIDPAFSTFNYIRLAWTFNNANSVTFVGIILGSK